MRRQRLQQLRIRLERSLSAFFSAHDLTIFYMWSAMVCNGMEYSSFIYMHSGEVQKIGFN